VRHDLHGQIRLTSIHGHAFAKQFHQVATGIHAQAQGSVPPASLAGSEARISLARSRFIGLSKRKAYPESQPGKGRGGFGLLLKQHIGHGVTVQGKGKASRRWPSAEAGWASSKRKARSVLGAELHTRRLSWRLCGQVGSDFDNIGFADLQIEELAQGGSPRVTSTASRKGRRPGLFIGANFSARAL